MLARSFVRVVSKLVIVGCALAVSLVAQQPNGAGGTTAPSTPSPAPTPTPPKGVPTMPTGPTQPTEPVKPPPTPIFISGIVALPDGTEPPERAVIERLCSSNNVRFEGYTDSKGHFGLQLGQNQQLIPDASTTMFVEANQGFSTSTRSGKSGLADPYFDCELRARLSGYISSTILLAGRRPMDNPDVGRIILYPINKIEGKAISATSANASRDARKAFDKGVREAKKKRFDQAEKELRRAVELHPKYAEAWLELGKAYAARKQSAEARDAFTHAIAADPAYVYPYEQLYIIAYEQTQWQELADTTERLLRLNPYEFPGAYYFNGVAHYQLRNWDNAEKSLKQAIQVDFRNVNPKTHYVMGLVMVQKRDYAQATQNLTTFTSIAPKDPQVPKLRALIEQIAALPH